MPKEWILNSAMNRFQLNFKRNVGATSESIRKCSPKTLEDFYIKIGYNYIGLQIKPVNSGIQLPEIHKEYALQAETHAKFTSKFGGKVFYIFSEKRNGKKEIANKEIIKEIQKEIERLHCFHLQNNNLKI